MSNMKRFFAWLLLGIVGLAPAAYAQASKPLLDTTMTFSQDGTAKVSQLSYEKSEKNAESNKIEASLVFYALVMQNVDDANRKALMGAVQLAVGKIATDKGLIRADLLKGVPFIKPLASAPNPAELKIQFAEVTGQGHSLEVKPENTGNIPLPSAVMFFFQDLTKNLSESGLRILVLAMGGMNKYYREVSPASTPDSAVKAPAYGMNLAVDIVENLGGKKGK